MSVENNTPNSAEFPPPFTVYVIQSERGNIGVHIPLGNCELCRAESRDLANIGTPMLTRFACRACRAERRAAA
jgi:hypothetical protein